MLFNGLFIPERLRHYLEAKTIYDIHSPLVYDLLKTICQKNKKYYDTQTIADLRTHFLSNKKMKIPNIPNSAISLSWIIRDNAISTDKGMMLFHLQKKTRATEVITIGDTGFAAAYLKSACSTSNLYSICPVPGFLKTRQLLFHYLEFKSDGIFNDFKSLQSEINGSRGRIFIYLHCPSYIEQSHPRLTELLKDVRNEIFLVVNQVFKSEKDYAAWKKLYQTVGSRLIIEYGNMGMICQANTDDKSRLIRFIDWKYKPWRIGIWG